MIGMQGRMLVARAGILGLWPQPRPWLFMMREAYPSVFPGRGCNELMPGYGFLKARRIVLNLFPQGLNRPYICRWARPRPQLGAAAVLAASLMALPSLVPARPLCPRLYCTRKDAPRQEVPTQSWPVLIK